jgi:RNA polymerase sigma-70 factor (ECF subfamily)
MDDDVLAQARDGSVDAFSVLVERRLPRLYRAAALIIRDEAAAADAVQDALIEAWRDLPTLRQLDRFDGWLHRILVRTCRRAAASRRARSVVELRLAVDHAAAQAAASTVVQRDQLARGFERLPVDQRTAVVLRHYLGLSIDETAAAMGIPVGTVLSRVNRGLSALRAALEADERPAAMASEVSR